jgi:hypothetical protein
MIDLFGLLQAGHYLPGMRKTAGMVTPLFSKKDTSPRGLGAVAIGSEHAEFGAAGVTQSGS